MRPHKPIHPRLTPEQERVQRGADPKKPLGDQPKSFLPSLDSDAEQAKLAQAAALVADLLAKKEPQARAPLSPRLLIRAAPGDHGRRLPSGPWPFWESPDIHIVPPNGNDPSAPTYDQATNTYGGMSPTLSPQSNKPYWIFVHLWNLGILPAINFSLSTWWSTPQFVFDLNAPDPTQRPRLVRTLNHQMLPGNQDPACHGRFLMGPWTPGWAGDGHECLLAKASCLADGGGTDLDAYRNRHVGQRNIYLVRPERDLGRFLGLLERALPDGADLELLHGLRDLDRLLLAHEPPLAKTLGAPTELNPAVAFPINDRSAHLGAVKALTPGARQWIPATVAGPKFGATGLDAALVDHPLVKPLPASTMGAAHLLMHHLGVADLKAGTLAARLTDTVGSAPGAGHVLRFFASKAGRIVGGYTLIIQT